MNKVTFPLQKGSTGEAIEELFEAIEFFLINETLKLDEQFARDFSEKFKSEKAGLVYADATAHVVYAFKEQYNLLRGDRRTNPVDIEANYTVDQLCAQKMNEILEEFGAFTSDHEETKYQVEGTVNSQISASAGGLTVKIWNKNILKDELLGESITDRFGRYQIVFQKRFNPDHRADGQPDLLVEVVMANGDASATSEIRYNASKKERIDILLDNTHSLKLRSEFETLTDTISEYFPRKLETLKEDEEHQQITYLANKTGWDARLIAMRSLAEQYHAKNETVSSALFYALFRAGFPSDLEALYQIDGNILLDTWKEAIEKNIIYAREEVLAEAQEIFAEKSVEYLLTTEQPILDLIWDEGTDEGKEKSDFIKLYKKHQIDMKTFWGETEKRFGEDKTKTLQLNGKLAYLTLNNVALIEKLHEIAEPKELIEKGFYKADTWKGLLTDLTLPNDMDKDAYADHIAAHLRLTYPTEVAATMVSKGEFKLKNTVLNEAVSEFLTSYQDIFHIGIQPVNRFVRENELVINESVKKEIQRIQRLYQIAPSDKEMGILSQRGFDSAHDVVQNEEEDFVDEYQRDLGGKESAKKIYQKAEQVNSTVFAHIMNEVSHHNKPIPYVLRSERRVKESSVTKQSATLETLFGEMDFCSCGHCNSVLSPAAYLVELLEFLNPKKGDKPLDVLLKRRPDIEHIELTCENTETVLPYIDLVNEILEYYVVNNNLKHFEGYNTGEDIKTEELLANPKNVETEAYKILKHPERVYPMNLPFNQPLEASREHFNQLKISLYESMELFRINDKLDNQDSYGGRDIYNEYLNISHEEYTLLTNSSGKVIKDYFGLSSLEEMGNAKKLARAIDISYKNLSTILKTDYMGISLSPIDPQDVKECDFGAFKLKDVTPGDYWKLMRFLRLWKKLGWSIAEVDTALRVLDPKSGDFDADFKTILIRLAQVKQIKTMLKINKKETFLELLAIWKGSKNDSPLIRLLELSSKEFEALKVFSDIDDPIKEPKYTLEFIKIVQMTKASDVSVQDLQYLFQHHDETAKSSPTKDEVLTVVKTIHDNLVAIENQYRIAEELTHETIQEKMSLVYGSDMTDKLFGWFSGSLVYRVEYSQDLEKLDEAVIEATLNGVKLGNKISYDHYAKKLIYKGRMTTAEKETILRIPGITSSFRKAVDTLYILMREDIASFVEQYPELDDVIYEKSIQDILNAFLPTLKKEAKYLAIKQTLASLLGVDQLLLNRVIDEQLAESKQYVLSAQNRSDEPVIFDFLNISNDKKIQKDFYLDVPKSGDYNFYIESSDNVQLEVNGSEIMMSPYSEVWQNNKPIRLESGKLNLFQITTNKIKNIQWQSLGMARDVIPDKYFYALEKVELFSKSYIRLLKALLLIERLKFSETEVAFISNVKNLKFLPDYSIFSKIPIVEDMTYSQVFFDIFIKLLKYNELKALLKINGDDLVTLLKNPDAKNEADNSLLLRFTGWDKDNRDELLERFGLEKSDLSNWENFLKVQKAYEIIKKVDIPADDFMEWITHRPTQALIEEMQEKMEEKYGHPKAWSEVQKSINDKLRNKQRDALVSYILYIIKKDNNPDTKHINTADKLYEYFLIDVQMDSCWKTSRIKQANSTVQLFIERCLMNLEPDVQPGTIKKKQWEWMKRYRVWEANRKVFLYPENWLEPEWRVDKSPFFKEFESELLQADITDDLAQQALMHYLEKLDTVAKLEISAMHQEYNEDGDKTMLHLFGRTPGMGRKYFYRKYNYTIDIWTPWEKVDLSIEDNPILPVIWNGSLFLFWLNIMKKGVQPKSEADGGIKDTAPKERVEVNLSWSEYYNNKWQPVMTSDVDNMIGLGDYSLDGFIRKNVLLGHKLEKKEKKLKIVVWYKLGGELTNVNFEFFNKHSLPIKNNVSCEKNQIRDIQLQDKALIPLPQYSSDELIYFPLFSSVLKINYKGNTHKLLNLKDMKSPSIVISNEDMKNNIEDPFIYQDEQYLFLVQPEGGVLPVESNNNSVWEFQKPPIKVDATKVEKGGMVAVKVTPFEQLTGGGRLMFELNSDRPFVFGNTKIQLKGVMK